MTERNTYSRRVTPYWQGPRITVTLAVLLSVGLALGAAAEPPGSGSRVGSGSIEPAFERSRVVGPRECSECHEAETAIWNDSHHRTGADLLPRSDAARAICKELGIRRVKADDRCTRCHYTVQELDGSRPKTLAGVSCESCHGGAVEWLDAHVDFGGAELTARTEDAGHRQERLADCDTKGMLRPGNLHAMASSCYRCHWIDDETIVAAGHPPTSDFELVSWSQGEIRHNFVRGGGQNAASDPAHLRELYVVGRLLELEWALRTLAEAEPEGEFAASQRQAVDTALERLGQIQATVAIEELGELLATLDSITSASVEELDQAVARVNDAGRRFSERSDGSELADLDGMIPGPESYR